MYKRQVYSLPSGPSFNSVSLPLSSLYLYPNVSEPPTFPFASNVAVCSAGVLGCVGPCCGVVLFDSSGPSIVRLSSVVAVGFCTLDCVGSPADIGGISGVCCVAVVLGCSDSGPFTVTSTVVPFNVNVSPNLILVSPPFPSFTVISVSYTHLTLPTICSV